MQIRAMRIRASRGMTVHLFIRSVEVQPLDSVHILFAHFLDAHGSSPWHGTKK